MRAAVGGVRTPIDTPPPAAPCLPQSAPGSGTTAAEPPISLGDHTFIQLEASQCVSSDKTICCFHSARATESKREQLSDTSVAGSWPNIHKVEFLRLIYRLWLLIKQGFVLTCTFLHLVL
jgi:hypothetical protein